MYAEGSAIAQFSREGIAVSQTYLTTDELADRMKYDARTIRNRLKDSVLLEGIHYFRPFGGRKILFIWEAIEEDMQKFSRTSGLVPMAGGGVCHG
jgi:hypothetical protein